jgi:hypothetical protein
MLVCDGLARVFAEQDSLHLVEEKIQVIDCFVEPFSTVGACNEDLRSYPLVPVGSVTESTC